MREEDSSPSYRATDLRGRGTEHAAAAMKAAMRRATLDGIRDLYEALTVGAVATPQGKAELIRGGWGALGSAVPYEDHTACPLTALFIREA